MQKWGKLIAAIAACELAGILGSIVTFSSIPTWYAYLNKPGFSPPDWLFGPVWIILYALMGASLYLVWVKGIRKETNRKGILTFAVQLELNVLWSWIFFGLRNPFYAFVEIIALWFFVLSTTYVFSKISRKAAYLLIPYLAWVSFAMVLNYYIWILN